MDHEVDLEDANWHHDNICNIIDLEKQLANHRKKVRGRKVKHPRKKLDISVAIATEWMNQFVIFSYCTSEEEKKAAFEKLRSLEVMTVHFLESKIGITVD